MNSGSLMTAGAALLYSFVFGLAHGILPDEHTWPITFSYAVGGASGRAGLEASLYFALAFTVQRMLVSELAYLALAPLLLMPSVHALVYLIVGVVMMIAGARVLFGEEYPHLHLLGHHHAEGETMETTLEVMASRHVEPRAPVKPLPARWTLVHGFIAGFGFGGFSLFVNTVAVTAMPGAWAGFLPGLAFGLGTAVTLMMVGVLIGASLRRLRGLTASEIQQLGAMTGGRTLFFGGVLFQAAGAATLFGLVRYLPMDAGYALIALFMVVVAIPAFAFSMKQVVAEQKRAEREAH